MNFKQLLEDDGAVSPVIGVILMVAITVILAAVIGTFVLGLGDSVQQTTPNAQFSGDQSSDVFEVDDGSGGDTEDYETITFTIAHDGGDGLNEDNTEVTVDGQQAWAYDNGDPAPAWDGNDDISAGDSITIIAAQDELDENDDFANNGEFVYDTDGGNENDELRIDDTAEYDNTQLTSDQTVRVVWTADDGDRSATLFERDVN